MSECIHGASLYDICIECDRPTANVPKPTEDESLHAQTNVLLQQLIKLQGTMLETMANLAHKVETIEHALKERIIEESNKLQYQDGDRSRQAAEAGSSDSAEQGKEETFIKETSEKFKAMTGLKNKWSYCHKHGCNFEWEKGDCLYCMQERDKAREVKLTGFDPYGDKDQ